jgi:hypothetical protein
VVTFISIVQPMGEWWLLDIEWWKFFDGQVLDVRQVLELVRLLVRLRAVLPFIKPFLVGGAPLERGVVTRGSLSTRVAFWFVLSFIRGCRAPLLTWLVNRLLRRRGFRFLIRQYRCVECLGCCCS